MNFKNNQINNIKIKSKKNIKHSMKKINNSIYKKNYYYKKIKNIQKLKHKEIINIKKYTHFITHKSMNINNKYTKHKVNLEWNKKKHNF